MTSIDAIIATLLTDPPTLTALGVLVAAIAGLVSAVASLAQIMISHANKEEVKASITTTAKGLSAQVTSVSDQAALAADHAAQTSSKVDEVRIQTNGALDKLRTEVAATNARNMTLQADNASLRQQLNVMTDLLHARGQARSTDRVAVAEVDHQRTLDTANAAAPLPKGPS